MLYPTGKQEDNKIEYALVAQLDRAFGYEPKGRGFESLQARHFKDSVRGSFLLGFKPAFAHAKGGSTSQENVTFSHLFFRQSLQARHIKTPVVSLFCWRNSHPRVLPSIGFFL